jgi:hypothetical protein
VSDPGSLARSLALKRTPRSLRPYLRGTPHRRERVRIGGLLVEHTLLGFLAMLTRRWTPKPLSAHTLAQLVGQRGEVALTAMRNYVLTNVRTLPSHLATILLPEP